MMVVKGLRCLLKVAVVDAVASDLRWIGKLFQIVGTTKLKARCQMLVGAKLLSGLYSMSVPITWGYASIVTVECTLINTQVVLSV